MSQIVYVSRLNPKTTEKDFERFCARFGSVVECVIFPENDKLTKRSGYVKFTSAHSAEKMYRQSREETFYIDCTSISIELCRGKSQPLKEKPKQTTNLLRNHSSTIYTLDIDGQITSEAELIDYLKVKPLSLKFREVTNHLGQVVRTGAQVTYNDKELVDRILKQNHDKYTIKLISNNVSVKRGHDSEPLTNAKRSKSSPNTYSSIKCHLDNLIKLTHDMYEENEHLKTDKNRLTMSLNQQVTKSKQIELEKSDLLTSSTQTHDIAKCLTHKYKLREDEHKKHLEECNRKMVDFENIIQTTNVTLGKAVNEIQRLTNHITTLEQQLKALTDKCTQSDAQYAEQQHDIEHFFSMIKRKSSDLEN